FRRTGWHLPAEVAGTSAEGTFGQTAEALFGAYQDLTNALLAHLQDAVERPAELDEGVYRRTLRARAFDVARSLLPLATHTSVGQIVSARVAERQVGRLLESPYAEIRAVGAELKLACQVPADAPLSTEPQPPAAPTLVKYAQASAYRMQVSRDLSDAAETWLTQAGAADRSSAVELAEPPRDPLDEIVATLLYKHDRRGRSFRQA